MEKALLSLALIAGIILTGCVETKMTVMLNKDGSGTLTITEEVTPEGVIKMSKLPDKNGGMIIDKYIIIDTEELTAKAAEYGAGLSFKNAEQIKKDGKVTGRKTVYKFNDINKVTLSSTGSSSTDSNSAQVVFSYTPGKLSMTNNQGAEECKKAMEQFAQLKMISEQMKENLKGAGFSMTFKVEGKITKTNAYYELPDKSGIITFEMNFSKLIDNKEALEVLSTIPSSDTAAFHDAIKGFDCIKIENQPKIEIEF